METILNLLKNFSSASGIELYIKLALLFLAGIAGIYGLFYAAKLRKKKADSERQSDRQQDISDNTEIEDQNKKDSETVRKKVAKKKVAKKKVAKSKKKAKKAKVPKKGAKKRKR